MNTVTVLVYNGRLDTEFLITDDVNEAMDAVHNGWKQGFTSTFIGIGGVRHLEPPIEDVVSQLSDDSEARHDSNRKRQKLP